MAIARSHARPRHSRCGGGGQAARRWGEGPRNKRGKWALGFGCHLDEDIAAERALSEVAQLLAVGKTIRLQAGIPPDFLRAHPDAARVPHDAARLLHPDLAEVLRALVAHLQRHGLETIAMDLSRPDLPLHAVKVFVPGLCHIWPQSPWPSRMSTVVCALAWLTPTEGAAQWNPQALFV
ncbi:MAG: YcaO-like family protein [Aquabacterium sp.]